MEAWTHMKLVTPGPNEPRPAPEMYYGKAKENKERYCEEYAKLHPEVEDPMTEPVDEVAMMLAGYGQPHGRPACLAGGFKPQRNFTQIKATLPSGSYATSSRTTCRSRVEVDSLPAIHSSTATHPEGADLRKPPEVFFVLCDDWFLPSWTPVIEGFSV
ncbi:uncharacterized protein [Lolium perenne]|uniref:uncharacterized protein n=1 Tax=Lolium perenne TaxID=4522 RepID=UPI003A99642B